MAKNLPAWLFLSVALLVLALAQLPLLRFAAGIDEQIAMPFTTVVVLMIGGLMSGLTAMLLLVKRAPVLEDRLSEDQAPPERLLVGLHAAGLLLFTGIPLLNFLVVYWLWVRHRHDYQTVNLVGQEVLNFQITIYLYLLLSLFMVFAVIGIVSTPLILILHFVCSLIAIVAALMGKTFHYPANIPVIQGRR